MGVTNIIRNTRENKMSRFGRVEERNNDEIVKKICEIRIEGKRGTSRFITQYIF